ncbi:putative ABC transporter permease [Ruminococcus sp. FC2018]|uniref:putative ABC transporter permease n=1 Tax=Ruminococcus sp. FC2018 TaxID=1410617 RepID=UPI0004919E39|nr:putative ABC transporter permease [Ruminococcus sp. FC2018]
MTEKTYTIDELCQLDEYPGIAYEQKYHFSRFTGKVIKHRDYHRDYTILGYILLFFSFSIGGWIWEVGIHVIEDGVFINRGTMHGPWLPIYGCGGVSAILVFKKHVDKQVAVFVGSVVMCGIAEYITSVVIEKMQGLKYWDYNGYFLNINGRICFEGMVVFGFACILVIYLLSPFLDNIFQRVSKKLLTVVAIILCVGFAIDLVYSVKVPNQGKGITDYSASIVRQIDIDK